MTGLRYELHNATLNPKPAVRRKEKYTEGSNLFGTVYREAVGSTSYFYQLLAVTQQEAGILPPSKVLFDIKWRAQQLLLITQTDRFAFSAHMTPSIKLPGYELGELPSHSQLAETNGFCYVPSLREDFFFFLKAPGNFYLINSLLVLRAGDVFYLPLYLSIA